MSITTPPILRHIGLQNFPVWAASVARAVNAILDGKHNAHGTVTLTANQATTVVSDSRVGGNSKITYSPLTANASAEVGAGTIYISTITECSFTLTHANNAQTDRDYCYTISG